MWLGYTKYSWAPAKKTKCAVTSFFCSEESVLCSAGSLRWIWFCNPSPIAHAVTTAAVFVCDSSKGISTVVIDMLQSPKLFVSPNSTSGSSFPDSSYTASGTSHSGRLFSSVLHSSDISRKSCSASGRSVRREIWSFELMTVPSLSREFACTCLMNSQVEQVVELVCPCNLELSVQFGALSWGRLHVRYVCVHLQSSFGFGHALIRRDMGLCYQAMEKRLHATHEDTVSEL